MTIYRPTVAQEMGGDHSINKAPTDKKNAEAGKETTIDRTLRLLYVTCSRAQESLALVLWSSDPAAAMARIKESQWFAEDEIQIIT